MKQVSTQYGYTMIEVLVALMIFSIATYLVGVSLVESHQYERVIKQQAKQFVQIQRGITLLTQDISQAVAAGPRQHDHSNGNFYTQDGQLFLVRLSEMNPDYAMKKNSLKQVSFYLEDNMVYRTMKTKDEPQVISTPILQGVTQLTWRFKDKNGGEYELWPPTQDWKNRLPSMVTVWLTFEKYGTIQRDLKIGPEEVKLETSSE